MMNSKLSNALNDEQKLTLNNVCRTFSTYSDEVAFKYLWNLTYKPEYALDKMGLIDQEYLTYYKKVRNYIAEESGHIEYIGIASDYPETLLLALQRDRYATKRILIAIDIAIYNYSFEELERIKALLTSNESNCQFGGLKSLKLNNEEANYFIENVETIANYFNNRLDEAEKHCGITTLKDFHGSFADELTESELSTTVDKTKEEGKNIENIIPMIEMFLKNKEAIERFLQACSDNDWHCSYPTSWILDKPEIFKKIIHILKLWEDIKSEVIEPDEVFKKSEIILKNADIVKYTDELKDLGINYQWIYTNRNIINSLFEGLNEAAL